MARALLTIQEELSPYSTVSRATKDRTTGETDDEGLSNPSFQAETDRDSIGSNDTSPPEPEPHRKPISASAEQLPTEALHKWHVERFLQREQLDPLPPQGPRRGSAQLVIPHARQYRSGSTISALAVPPGFFQAPPESSGGGSIGEGRRRSSAYPVQLLVEPPKVRTWLPIRFNASKVKWMCEMFAMQTGVNAIPFAHRAGRWYTRTFWLAVLLSLTAGCIWNSWRIYAIHATYGTSAAYTINSDSGLAFPSVSLCNLNPLRRSMIDLAPGQLQDFLLGTTNSSGTEKNNASSAADAGNSRGVGSDDLVQRYVAASSVYQSNLALAAVASNSAYGSGSISPMFERNEQFKALQALVTSDTRLQIGHQIDTLLVQCSFNGLECTASNFSQFLDPNYGNCYTFNSADLIANQLYSFQRGPNFGLNLVLYVEENEYLTTLRRGLGVRVAVHPFNSIPLMAEQGFSVAPGYSTSYSIRRQNASMMGLPFDNCDDNTGSFTSATGRTFITESCLGACLDLTLASQCKCFRPEYPHFWPANTSGLVPCFESINVLDCYLDLLNQSIAGNVICNCYTECNRQEYDLESSSAAWPNSVVWYSLVNKVCQTSQSDCETLQRQGSIAGNRGSILRKNFLTMKIYFADSVYKSIVESEADTLENWFSVMAGLWGVWIGASAISAVEFLVLITWVIYYGFVKRVQIPSNVGSSPIGGRSRLASLADLDPQQQRRRASRLQSFLESRAALMQANGGLKTRNSLVARQ